MNRRIAIIEDDEVIRSNYCDVLTGAGFQIHDYATKDRALSDLQRSPVDLVLLDISLNGERDAGFGVCAELRRRDPLVPIVFLTSHDNEVDKISGLRLGADDYLTKDISFDYLIVRIEALFRRREALIQPLPSPASNAALNSSAFSLIPTFDECASTVQWHGTRVDITLTQYWMLRALCATPGGAMSHAELMRAAKLVVEPNTITAHIKAIRDAFRRIDPSFDGIRTERGRGYRWLVTNDAADQPSVAIR